MTGHLLLIDASGFAHRAYHTGANQFRSDGLPTWAITGFLGMVWRLLGAAQHDQPTHAAAVFDFPGKTFRSDLFPDYKTNRPARDVELKVQLPYMRHAAEVLGIRPIEHEGFEADDVIATLATKAAAEGWRTTIVSSDKDFCQLVIDDVVEIVDPVAHVRLREKDVRDPRKFGVSPARVPDVQALAGDSVDNIPGIDRVGIKSASHLVRMFGDIEGVVAAAHSRPSYFTPTQRLQLKAAETIEQLKLYRTLATLRRDVPVPAPWGAFELQKIMTDQVQKLLKVLEASGRFEAIFAQAPKLQRLVDGLAKGNWFDWWEEELAVPGQRLWDIPQCGFYMRRLVKGGVFVPARIWREPELDFITGEPTGMEILRCEVGEDPRDPVLEWERLAKNPITRERYDFEMADRTWARQYAPDDPKAKPTEAIDRRSIPAVQCPKPVSQKRKKSR